MAESILIKVTRDKAGALTAYWDDGKGNIDVSWWASETEMIESERLYPEVIARQIALSDFLQDRPEFVKSIDEKHEAPVGMKTTVDFSKANFATIEAAAPAEAQAEAVK